MKNNIIYLIIFLILLGVAGYFLSQNEGSSTLEGRENYNFSVQDTGRVNKIVISDKKPSSITLIKKGDQWLVNGEYPARKDAIEVLLKTLHRMELRNFVPDRKVEQVERKIEVYGKEVQVYKNGKLAKHFYVGKETASQTGTYMKMKGGDRPYAVHIPGFNGFLNSRFFTETHLWRSRDLVRMEPRNIKEVKMIYPDSSDQSFMLRQFSPDSLYIVKLQNGKVLKNANELKARLFLAAFRNLKYEGAIIPSDPIYERRDSLLASTPAFRLEVKDIDGHKTVVSGYRIVGPPSGYVEDDPSTHYDPNKLHGFINEQRMVLLQYYGLRKVLKPLNYFVQGRES